MGRMKDIAIDIMDLHQAAVSADNEETFMQHVSAAGWVSPTEQAGRRHQASLMLAGFTDDERITAKRVLDAVGIDIPAVDFPFKTLVSASK